MADFSFHCKPERKKDERKDQGKFPGNRPDLA
jgi:hypothetical protein